MRVLFGARGFALDHEFVVQHGNELRPVEFECPGNPRQRGERHLGGRALYRMVQSRIGPGAVERTAVSRDGYRVSQPVAFGTSVSLPPAKSRIRRVPVLVELSRLRLSEDELVVGERLAP